MNEGEVVALLGPTNTGKTHRAVTRMLQHRTGMIGLPLRLLAREVYDRITAEKGEQAVALVTGEEKRIPADPRWWVCTVEAMPTDKAVAFLAVDEIQLAGDRNRGHVFTDRLLHARGVRETWFLGSETIAPILEALVPHARIERHARFSRLTYDGAHGIGKLPSRTAVLAFSTNEVYALAERVRQRHGGAAVVLGALSPRTRNAQVAMYQAGEVPCLVATDAIGMGLNMDVAHVAFSALRKFDGFGHRGLTHAEVAQIAGRAGRHKRDGTFGATEDCVFDPETIAAVEAHAFPPLKRLWWRNSELDFSSVAALSESLIAPPRRPFLQMARDEEDAVTLAALAPRVGALRGENEVRLLWECCRIPDFRKTMTDAHVELVFRLWRHLSESGRIPAGWIGKQLDELDRLDGDLDRLTTRIAWVRTWTYVSHRSAWLDDAPAWQARAREVEDRLSDALHAALTERFVDRKAMVLASAPATVASSEVRAGSLVLGTLEGLAWRPADADPRTEKAARAALGGEMEARVQRFAEARHADITVDDDGTIRWEGGAVARFVAGPALLEPGIKLLRNDLLGPGAVARVQRRLQAFARDFVADLLAPLQTDARLSGPSRGLLFELSAGLGVAAPRPPARERDVFARMGVRFGVHHCFSLPMVERVREKTVLATAFGLTGDALLGAVGTPRVGGVPVRVDHLERIASEVRRGRPAVGILGEEETARVVEALMPRRMARAR